MFIGVRILEFRGSGCGNLAVWGFGFRGFARVHRVVFVIRALKVV